MCWSGTIVGRRMQKQTVFNRMLFHSRHCSSKRSVIKRTICVVGFGPLMDGFINHVSYILIKQALKHKDPVWVMVHLWCATVDFRETNSLNISMSCKCKGYLFISWFYRQLVCRRELCLPPLKNVFCLLLLHLDVAKSFMCRVWHSKVKMFSWLRLHLCLTNVYMSWCCDITGLDVTIWILHECDVGSWSTDTEWGLHSEVREILCQVLKQVKWTICLNFDILNLTWCATYCRMKDMQKSQKILNGISH